MSPASLVEGKWNYGISISREGRDGSEYGIILGQPKQQINLKKIQIVRLGYWGEGLLAS